MDALGRLELKMLLEKQKKKAHFFQNIALFIILMWNWPNFQI